MNFVIGQNMDEKLANKMLNQQWKTESQLLFLLSS